MFSCSELSAPYSMLEEGETPVPTVSQRTRCTIPLFLLIKATIAASLRDPLPAENAPPAKPSLGLKSMDMKCLIWTIHLMGWTKVCNNMGNLVNISLTVTAFNATTADWLSWNHNTSESWNR